MSPSSGITKTGGREATTRHIPPKIALAVGKPAIPAPQGWRWVALTEVARLESGHTPSRRHPEYWEGDIPWISIQDAKSHHGRTIHDTNETTNDLGIANSAARLLPKDTVCLSRTASVGYVIVLGRSMATSQDFVNWICSSELDPKFLQYLLISEGKEILRFASGSVHPTIYFPEVKAFHICCPPLPEQQRIVCILDLALEAIAKAKANTEENLQNARALFESYLESVLIDPAGDWEERPFGDLCNFKHGFAFRSEFFTHQGRYVMLTPGNFHESGGYRDRGDKQKYYSGQIPSGFILCESDLLVAMTEQAPGLLGSPILVPESDRFLHNQRLGLVSAKAGVPWSNRFFFYVFNTRKVRKSIHRSASGVKVRHTSPAKISEVIVSFPNSVAQQNSIASSLDRIRDDTERLESIYRQKLAALDELKKSLLHQAFTGNL